MAEKHEARLKSASKSIARRASGTLYAPLKEHFVGLSADILSGNPEYTRASGGPMAVPKPLRLMFDKISGRGQVTAVNQNINIEVNAAQDPEQTGFIIMEHLKREYRNSVNNADKSGEL
jgi:hypothetical protein